MASETSTPKQTFTLDGKDIPFEPGDTIIQAAHRVGIDIPHYCWHPGLSVAANCRMCLVEVGPPPGRPAMMLDVLTWDAELQQYVGKKKPKLQPACQMQAAPGMDVKSQSSEHVRQARSAVQELLLLQHPVDCPICDQAGECRLQDYWLEHGANKKRMLDERIKKPKAVEFGPTIVYDAERCIVCTRCVRFSAEVAKDPVLDKRERGNLSEIVLAPGRQLDHGYTLMTEYVCPVGALTAKDFRFKARVWFLRSRRGVCTGCATGCNTYTDFDPRNHHVYRYRPRENMDVNRYWMCDDGMLDYQRIHGDRVERALIKGEPVDRDGALEKAAKHLRSTRPTEAAVVLSAQHSVEDNFAVLALAKKLGIERVFWTGKPDGEGDDVLRSPDKNPNRRGIDELVAKDKLGDFAALCAEVESHKVRQVLALGSYSFLPEPGQGLASLEWLVTLATHRGELAARASVVLPTSSWAESDGTFVNARGLSQRSERVIPPSGDSRPAWKIAALLAERLGHELPFKKVSDVKRAMHPDETAAPPAVEGASA